MTRMQVSEREEVIIKILRTLIQHGMTEPNAIRLLADMLEQTDSTKRV